MIDFYNDCFNDVSGKYYGANEVCLAYKSTKMQTLQLHFKIIEQSIKITVIEKQSERYSSMISTFLDNGCQRQANKSKKITSAMNSNN